MFTRDLSRDKPEDFLNPMNFVTVYDGADNEDYRKDQEAKGLDIGGRAIEIIISTHNVWSARMRPQNGFARESLSSSETIGYHAGTAALLRGFIDSGCRIVVCRNIDGKFSSTVIQEGKQE